MYVQWSLPKRRTIISDVKTKCSIWTLRNDGHNQTGAVFDGTIQMGISSSQSRNFPESLTIYTTDKIQIWVTLLVNIFVNEKKNTSTCIATKCINIHYCKTYAQNCLNAISCIKLIDYIYMIICSFPILLLVHSFQYNLFNVF